MKVLKGALIAASAGAVMAVLSAAPASAAGITFTWNPSLATPSLGGSAITANNYNLQDFDTVTITDGAGDFTENGVLNINDFLMGSTKVTPAALGTTYSLFYVYTAGGNQGGAIPTSPGGTINGSITSLTYTLYAYAGATPAFTPGPTGVTFVAPGAFALGTGQLIPSPGNTTSLTLTGSGLAPDANVEVNFAACTAAGGGIGGVCTANESNFFVSPPATTAVITFGNFGATGSVVTQGTGAFSNQIYIDGGGGNATEALAPVPEPVTISLFGAGLAGAAFARRRKSKKA